MNVLESLSPSDVAILETGLAEFSARAKHEITLERLISRWQELADSLTEPYEDDRYEYDNDVSVRELLQILIWRMSLDGAAKLGAVLNPIDRRFFAHTVWDAQRLPLWLTGGWWWYRLPREGFGASDEIGEPR